MGNELASHSNLDLKAEQHTDDEEAPLNEKPCACTSPDIIDPTAPSQPSSQSPASSLSVPSSDPLPPGWETRTDPATHKARITIFIFIAISVRAAYQYYVDHNTRSTQWNPPNTITKINDTWTRRNTLDDRASVLIHSESKRVTQLSDCWDIENPKQNERISFAATVPNTICLKTGREHSRRRDTLWISCFGTKIVTKGEYKRWQIKILSAPQLQLAGARDAVPAYSSSNEWQSSKTKKTKVSTARVMIGVVDIDSISARDAGQAVEHEHGFWTLPYFGYAFGGENGRKYHLEKKGKHFSKKYRVGDVITVELNRTWNRYIMHDDLSFFTNERVDGMAFNVDSDRNYVLAVSLCDDQCALQICD